MRIHRTARGGAIIAALALVAAFAVPSAASATTVPAVTTPAAVDGGGWLRLGHFSPETKNVDVRVAALSGGSVLFELSGVGYGDVSPYQALPTGSYSVSMVPAGSDDWTKLALSATVKITGGTATTAAAYGPTKALKVRLYQDDLTSPTAGNARIRVIQASTVTPTVDVRTSTGVSIASRARAGTATGYAEVAAGDWTLRLTGAGVSDTAQVSVAAGSVTSLFVLDTSDGGLTIVPVLDSAATAVTPIGGVQTGGGWLAAAHTGAFRAFAPTAE